MNNTTKPPFGIATHRSKIDRRDHKDKTLSLVSAIPDKHISDISTFDIRMQFKVGKCIGEASAKKCDMLLGNVNSGDFIYLGTKIKVDGNLTEGTSIRSALKFMQNYGVCSRQTFFIDVNDATQYADYIKNQIPQTAYDEALGRKIGRYSSVPVDVALLKAAIYKYGSILVRMNVGQEWYTPSWKASDIMPLKKPKKVISGHCVVLYGYDTGTDGRTTFYLANSWSSEWGDKGNGWFVFEDYKPTEAWLVTLEPVPPVDKSPYLLDNVVNGFLAILRKIGIIS